MIRHFLMVVLLGLAVSNLASAAFDIPDAPEIDGATGAQALALLSGATMLIRSKRKSER